MVTNREKYIESLSNRELADLLANKCNIWKNKINTYSDETKEAVDIEIWLSQEAEEDIVHILHIDKIPKTDKIENENKKGKI